MTTWRGCSSPSCVVRDRLDPYMLSLLDVAKAIEARRRLRPGWWADLGFLRGSSFPGPRQRRVSAGGRGRARFSCRREESRGPVLEARGLALLYAGAQSTANLRFAGLLNGGTPADDELLDALFAGRQFHIRDYSWKPRALSQSKGR